MRHLLNDYKNGIKIEKGLENQVGKYEYTEKVKVEVHKEVVAPDDVEAQRGSIEARFGKTCQVGISKDSRRNSTTGCP